MTRFTLKSVVLIFFVAMSFSLNALATSPELKFICSAGNVTYHLSVSNVSVSTENNNLGVANLKIWIPVPKNVNEPNTLVVDGQNVNIEKYTKYDNSLNKYRPQEYQKFALLISPEILRGQNGRAIFTQSNLASTYNTAFLNCTYVRP